MFAIHCCATGGSFVFLDIARDRYFCLTPAGDAAFRAYLTDAAATDRLAIAPLIDAGLVAPGGEPCFVHEQADGPTAALADASGPGRTRWIAATRAAIDLLAARRRLRRQGLAQCLVDLAQARRGAGHDDPARRDRIAAAFRHTELVLSPLDRCLPRSLALASRLARARLAAELVIGVQLRPFRAHAWVQSGALLLNDRLERVRPFTPIFRL